MSKTAIVVFSNPNADGDEALGRLFNALFLTSELKEKDQDVALIFQGTGVRWAGQVTNPDHPAHALFKSVEDKLVGVCGGCADAFGASEVVEKSGLRAIRERPMAGTSGILDLSRYLDDGYRLITF
jgi:hypothetical protein